MMNSDTLQVFHDGHKEEFISFVVFGASRCLVLMRTNRLSDPMLFC